MNMAEHEKNKKRQQQDEEENFAPLGELRPVDQPTDVLTATTVGDAGKVIAGDAGATARETLDDENLETK
jgi:hypothetical protein